MNFEEQLEQCQEKLKWATEQLEVKVDDYQLAEIAELIVQTMTGPWRYFHTPEHIFEVGGAEDAIEVLAALFHDAVYVQVDRSVNFNLSYYIVPFIKELKGELQIRDSHKLPPDRTFEMVASVFGFAPGQALSPFAGQNEFLSALVAAKVLEPFLKLSQLCEIAACIEATIPFPPISEDGLTASDRLYKRLRETNQTFHLEFADEQLLQVVKKAVRLANRDVVGFATPSSANFLDNTWNLLPETNHNLTNSSSYTVQEYRSSLQKMEGFMNFLQPEVVFRKFQGEPDDLTFQGWVNGARKNIEVARLYLGSKLFTIAFVEALSLRVGIDIPLSTIMGELPSKAHMGANLEEFIPVITDNPHPPQTYVETEVLTLLEKGRSKSSAYDIKHSPLTTFMVKSVGFGEIQHQRDRAKEFFKGNISPEDFLAGCEPEVTKIVTECVLKVFDSRKAALSR